MDKLWRKMQQPPSRLSEIVSSLKKVSSCQSCRRSPSSVNTNTSYAHPKNNNDSGEEVNQHRHYYDGQLLTTSCGHFFCQDCWDKSIDCPICQGSTSLEPRPIISSLDNRQVKHDSCHAPPQAGDRYSNKAGNQFCNLQLQSADSLCSEESIEQMCIVLGMLRQMRGVPMDSGPVKVQVPSIKNTRERVDDSVSNKKNMGDVYSEDSDSEEETQLPGKTQQRVTHTGKDNDLDEDNDERDDWEKTQCWEKDATVLSMATPCMPNSVLGKGEQKDICTEKETDNDNHLPGMETQGWERDPNILSLAQQYTPSLSKQKEFETQQWEREVAASSFPTGTKRNNNCNGLGDVDETPTVHESQISSVRLSSIKDNKKVLNTDTIKETEKVAGTNMSSYYRNKFGRHSNPLAEKEVSRTSYSPYRPVKLYNSQSQSRSSKDGPRRVSTSPAKARRCDFETSKHVSSPKVTPSKRPRANETNSTMHSSHHGPGRGPCIHPWNIQSEPYMSQLTCDVRTCPTGAWFQDPTQRPFSDLSPTMSPLPNSVQKKKKQQLFVAYDVIDPVEDDALKMLHEQGHCQLLLDGVQSVNKDHGYIPFPSVLITHAIDKPGLGSQIKKTISVCYRSRNYLKAKALGACIVDARWVIDSHTAGGSMLDIENYQIFNDLETYNLMAAKTITDVAAPARESNMAHNFDGITFGLLQGLECNVVIAMNVPRSQSPLHIEPKPITKDDIESLVQMWGGRVTSDELTHMDFLLVDESMTLNQIRIGLQEHFKNSTIDRWSIEKSDENILNNFIVDGSLTRDYGEGLQVKIPILRSKWLEDCICFGNIQDLERYCFGILVL